jgi:hypothetical protein
LTEPPSDLPDDGHAGRVETFRASGRFERSDCVERRQLTMIAMMIVMAHFC